MQKIGKRILSLLLTFVMLLGLIPVIPQVSAASTDTETASDMLATATYAWSSQDWTGAGQFSYASDSNVTNGEDSLRSWRFSTTAQTGYSYARLQINLQKSYDMTNKDLVFDVKADPANELTSYSIGIVPYASDWKPVHDATNYQEYQVYFTGSDWTTVTVDNSILKAYLQDGRDINDICVLYLSFYFPAGAQNIYIDNMRLVDHNYGTDAQDAATDLLVNAEIVENGADGSTYTYEHSNTLVAFGDESNSSHKYSAAAGAANMFTVKYDLGKSYDLNNKNIVMDMLSYRGGNGFAFSLYNSQNQLVSYSESYTTVNQWAQVTPAILAGLQSGKNLSDVRYIAIGPRFATNTTHADRAFYVDNVRIENIDVHFTPLQDKNIVFMGDSITAAYGYKGWAGELQEHYRINPHNIGVGGASYATLDGRTTIYAQTANIPNVDVDFFVLNGGVNDIWSKANLGAVSNISVDDATANSFDTNTTAGAMEQVFCYLRQNHADAKIAFIINYICYSTEIDGVRFRDEFAPLAKAICAKWGVTCVDLTDNTEISALYGVHTYDGVHGNDVGYELVMRELAPVLVSMCGATEQTEQNSDLLAYAAYSWSAENWSGNLSYTNSCTDVSGNESTRSWKFSAAAAQTGNAGIQLQLNNLDNFTLTGKKLCFDVKFESSNGKSVQNIGLRLYDRNWKSVTGESTVWVDGNGSNGWQTVTVDASVFENLLENGCNLDEIMLVYFQFNFAGNAGNTQNIYIDNFRVISETATDATEAASDLLYGAGFVEGSINGEGMSYEQFNTTFLHGADSKYSYRFYIEDDKTAWATATFILPRSIDLTQSTMQFDVNQYNQVALWVDLYDSNYKLVTGDNYTLREIGWQTYEINALYGLADGRTAENLKDIRYIRFSFNFDPANTGRTVVIDNLTTYKNEHRSSMAAGLNGLYLGDSIAEAQNYKGWHGEMAEHYGVTGYNVAVGGRTLANDGIYSELANVPADMKFDFVMLNGVVNDYFASVATGTLTPEGTTTFDSTTAIGSLEKLFHGITSRYPDAEVFYILNFVPNWSSFRKTEYVNDFVPLAKQACEKWGVHCLDLVNNTVFLAEFDVTADVHTFDGLHPNKAGFDVITPYVVTLLEETMCADASVRYQQLSLGDDLSMRFDIAVSGAYADTATVTVTVDGTAVMENVSFASLAAGVTGCKMFTLDMAAAQMTDEIVVTISDGDTVLTQKSYTVRDYIKTLIEGNYDEKLQALAKAALNYGAGAQVYFDHHADTLANAGYETTETVAIPEINTDNMVSGEVSGIRFYGASLVYNSKIAVRFYFDVTGDISNYTFSMGNEPVLKDGLYYVEIDGINPQDYAKETALTVSDGSQEMTVTYSPMYYIGRMYNKTDKQSLKTLLGAMYSYHLAAVDYVAVDEIRGSVFTAGQSTLFDVIDGEYDILSFDYKIDGEGEIAAIIRGTEWLKFYGDYRLTAEGEKYDYVGITTEKLDDGYIHVTFDLAVLERSGCVDNRDGAPTDVSVIDVYDWTTANGYIDNIQVSNKEPEDVIRGEAFEGGVTKTIVLSENATENLAFDYKLTTDGDIRVILRAPDWNGFYGDFTFDANGLVWSYQTGITTEKLDDGYIRVYVDFAQLNRSGCNDNLDSAPASVGIFDIYSWGTADGYIDNIQLDAELPEEEVIRGEVFNGNDGKIIYLEENAYESITFDYKLTNNGTIRLLLRDIDAWTTGVYGDFFFDAAGETMDYSGITTETLSDGYIRVIMNFAQLNRTCLVDNRDGAPDKVGVFDIYSGNTGDGYIDNIQLDAELPEEEVIRGEAFEGGVTKTIVLSENTTENLAFDYKLTTDGDIRVILRAPDWNGFYGDFTFDANGLVWSYQTGITTEKLDDGYIRVYVDFAQLNRSGCNDNLDSAPASVGIFDIYSWGTADGYIDNIRLDIASSEENEPTEPETPEEPVIRGEVYNAGEKINYMIPEGDYATISFEYKLVSEGFIRVMLRSPADSECYGSFYFTAEGEREDYSGVACEKLSDGYIRVTVTTKEVTITGNSDGREKVPATVNKVCVYRDSTASGYIDNIQVTEKDPTEEAYRGMYFVGGATSNVTLDNTVFEEITFEYTLTSAGEIAVALRSPTDVPYYGLYYFNANGLATGNNAGVYTEKLDDGYVRVKMVLAELGRTNNNDNRDNVPETVSKLVFYKFGTANGYVDKVSLKLPPPERGDVLTAGQDWSYTTDAAAYETVTVDYRLTNDGQVAFALTDATKTNYFGYFHFDKNGEVEDYAGVSTMVRSDEYIKITFDIAELAINSGVAPASIACICVEGSESTATGFVDYVQFKKIATPTGVRFGVLSDVHVGAFEDDQYTVRLIHALTAFKERGVDAVLISGDLQNHTTDLELSKKWIEIFAETWFSVFPNNTNNLTGEHVEPVFICGNHDQQLVAEQYWPESLGAYSDAFIKEVNGYYFVGAHFWRESAASDYILRAKEDSSGYPFFYTQHCTLYNTVYGITDSGHGTAETNLDELWDAYNAITFTGHTHIPATDERSIWQSLDDKYADFTAIQVPSLNYGRLSDLGLTAPGNYNLCEQGMYVVVEGSDVTITRLDFADHDNVLGKQLGENWSFDAADPTDRPYDYTVRAEQAHQPEFADDAEITVDFLSKSQISITVPTATVTAPEGFSDAIQLYYVELVKVATGEILQTDVIETEYLYDLKPERFDGPFSTTFFGLEDNSEYQLRVYAREFYQVQSEPLTMNFNTADAPADVVRGQQFTAETNTYVEFEAGAYEAISFDYRVTNVGEMVIVLRSTEWIPYYGTFNFNANGAAMEYEGIYCQRLDDNYIRVTMYLSELNVTNNNNDRLNAPDQVKTLDIYNWTTVNGYFDNLQLYKQGEAPEKPSEPEEPTEPEIPEEPVIRGEVYNAGEKTNYMIPEGNYATISFEYKLTTDGEINVMLRSPSDTPYYGGFKFDANGEVQDYAGVECEKLDDGYIRVTVTTADVERTNNTDNLDNIPATVSKICIYRDSTASGYIDSIQYVVAEETEILLLLQKCNGTNATCSARDYSNLYFSTTPFTSANDTLTLVVKTDYTSIKLRGMSNLGDEWSGSGVTKTLEDIGNGWKTVTWTLSEIVGSNDVTTMNGFKIEGLVDGADILMKDILINGQTDWVGEFASTYHGVVTQQQIEE